MPGFAHVCKFSTQSHVLGYRRSAIVSQGISTGKIAQPVLEPTGHGVNLGSLYAEAGGQNADGGWAYFEDGSIYLLTSWWKSVESSDFEGMMRLLEPFVRQPPPPIRELRAGHPNPKRLLIVE